MSLNCPLLLLFSAIFLSSCGSETINLEDGTSWDALDYVTDDESDRDSPGDGSEHGAPDLPAIDGEELSYVERAIREATATGLTSESQLVEAARRRRTRNRGLIQTITRLVAR